MYDCINTNIPSARWTAGWWNKSLLWLTRLWSCYFRLLRSLLWLTTFGCRRGARVLCRCNAALSFVKLLPVLPNGVIHCFRSAVHVDILVVKLLCPLLSCLASSSQLVLSARVCFPFSQLIMFTFAPLLVAQTRNHSRITAYPFWPREDRGGAMY